MSIEGIGASSPQILEKAQSLAQETPGQVEEFSQILDQLEQRGGDPGQAVQTTIQLDSVNGPSSVDALYRQKLEKAQEPGGVTALLDEVQASHAKLNDLLGELQSGRTFSPQELLGLQAEIQQISLQVETTTKVVGEIVSNVKQVMQQQI